MNHDVRNAVAEFVEQRERWDFRIRQETGYAI